MPVDRAGVVVEGLGVPVSRVRRARGVPVGRPRCPARLRTAALAVSAMTIEQVIRAAVAEATYGWLSEARVQGVSASAPLPLGLNGKLLLAHALRERLRIHVADEEVAGWAASSTPAWCARAGGRGSRRPVRGAAGGGGLRRRCRGRARSPGRRAARRSPQPRPPRGRR